MIAFDESNNCINCVSHTAKITVLGVGGAGNNTVNGMIDANDIANVTFIAANTDSQALEHCRASTKIQLGIKLTKGLGSGANPEVGKRAAEEDLDKLIELIGDADLVFLAAGMGGGTGSGALPVIARALRERGILTVAFVTKPFGFEGKRRERVAQQAIKELQENVDTLIVIPNQKLLDCASNDIAMVDAFNLVNDILNQSVKGISYIITKAGHINVDFADLRAIMKDMGRAVMGTGRASGHDRAIQATQTAISSPLLENMSIRGAKGVLINVSGGLSLSLQEINQAASVVYEQADPDANIILGSVIDENIGDELIVTVVATGCTTDEMPVVKTKPATVVEEAVKNSGLQREVESEQPSLVAANQAELDSVDIPAFLRHGNSAERDITEE